MNTDLLNVFGILILSIFIIYIFYNINNKTIIETFDTNKTTNKNNNQNTAFQNNIKSNAKSYATNINNMTLDLMTTLASGTSTFNTDYENSIIALHDYLGALMVKESLSIDLNKLKNNMDITSLLENLQELNILKNARDALDDTMKYYDASQKSVSSSGSGSGSGSGSSSASGVVSSSGSTSSSFF
jgi:uncharacterized membrane protein YgcG